VHTSLLQGALATMALVWSRVEKGSFFRPHTPPEEGARHSTLSVQ